MDGRARSLIYLIIVVGLAFSASMLLVSCQKREPVASTQTKAPDATVASPQTVAVAGEQTTCPVMGGAINKDIFVEYEGKKVYFCCSACPDAFKADPQKYIAKLRQFAR